MRCAAVDPTVLPPGTEVAREYRQFGGSITEEAIFGCDPFLNDGARRASRDREFVAMYQSLTPINSHLVIGQEGPFQQALLAFLDLTNIYVI